MKLLLPFVVSAFLMISSNEASEALDMVKAKIKVAAEECAKETGASDDDLNKFLARINPDSEAGHCMLYCTGQRTGTLYPDGKYTEEGFRTFFEPIKDTDPDIYNSIFVISHKCKEKFDPNVDHCKNAANYFECQAEAEKEIIVNLGD